MRTRKEVQKSGRERGVMGMSPAPITKEQKVADEQTVDTEAKQLGEKEFKLEGKDSTGNVVINTVKIFEFAGKTKGKGSRNITYWAFDDSKPDTLPKNALQLKASTAFLNTDARNPEGVEFTNDRLLEFMIDGLNTWSYNKQADEIGEYLNPEWPEDIQGNFRIAVRNTSKMTGMSIEDTANFLKGKVEEAYLKLKNQTEATVTA
jgi:hypothetical protein